MRYAGIAVAVLLPFLITSCVSSRNSQHRAIGSYESTYSSSYYTSRLPQKINTNEKVIVVSPSKFAWGAYDANGNLVRGGIATSGDTWCADIGRPCKTATGSFRIKRLGSGECKSSQYPKPNGGGLMPYCMFFHGGMAIHGSPSGAVVEDNISHGCVRVRIPDAEWLRNNFAKVGTKVIVKPY